MIYTRAVRSLVKQLGMIGKCNFVYDLDIVALNLNSLWDRNDMLCKICQHRPSVKLGFNQLCLILLCSIQHGLALLAFAGRCRAQVDPALLGFV